MKLHTFLCRFEISKISFASTMRSVNVILYDLGPRLISFATFTVYGAIGNSVTTSIVFSVLVWSHIMRFSIGTAIPLLTMSTVEMLVSVRRTQVQHSCKT